MIEVVFEYDHIAFMNKVRSLVKEGYVIKGCECAKTFTTSFFQPFIYTAILILNR